MDVVNPSGEISSDFRKEKKPSGIGLFWRNESIWHSDLTLVRNHLKYGSKAKPRTRKGEYLMIPIRQFRINVMMSCFVFLSVSNCVSIKSNYLKLRYGSAIEEPIAPEKLRFPANDVRVFQKSPVWELAKAIFFYDFAKVKLLCEKYKSALDTPDPYVGNSLLIFSIRTENEEAVKILLEAGANPNFKNAKSSKTPMQHAAKSTLAILRMLAAKGGDPNWGTEKNPPALVQADSLEHLKIMLSAGGDIQLKNKFGGSLLIYEHLIQDRLEIILYLLRAGADYQGQLSETVGKNYGKKKEEMVPVSLVDKLRLKTYPLDSDNYKLKMEIVAFLKEKGIDYGKAPIP